MATGLIDNFWTAPVSIATASGSNTLSEIANLRAELGVVARRRTNGFSKITTMSLDNYIENTSDHHGYPFKL